MNVSTRNRRAFDLLVCVLTLLGTTNRVHGSTDHAPPASKKDLRIVTIVEPPYVIQDAETGKFSGMMIDILTEAGISLDHVTTPIHSAYGYEEKPGEFNGMIGDLANETYDLAVAPLSIRSKRAKVVTFSQPVIHHGYLALYKIPKHFDWDLKVDAIGTLIKPFSAGLWCLTILMCLAASIGLYVIRRFSPYEDAVSTPSSGGPSTDNSFSDNLMFTLGSMAFRTPCLGPRSPSGRVLTCFWWVFCLMTVSAYIAGLVVTLFRSNPHLRSIPFESVEEMISGTEVKVLGVKNSATFNYMKGHKGHFEMEMYEYWKHNWDTTMVDSFPQALKMMEEGDGKYAVFMSEDLADYLANQEPCDKMVIGSPVGDLTIGFACRTDSGVCDDLNHVILRLQEEGKMEALRHKYFWSKCHKSSEIFFEGKAFFDTHGGDEPGIWTPHSLTIKRFSAAFIVIILGIVLAIAFLVGEICWAKRKGNIHRRLKTMSRADDARGIHDFSTDQDA